MTKNRKKHSKTFIREWRKHRGLTQEQLAARLGTTQATIARIERGDIGYTQLMLEALAVGLKCTQADLLMRAPNSGDDIRDMISGLSPSGQKRALAVIKALKDSEEAA
jgi:transcriptional regulator with XRE-family HTH domain